AAIQAAGAPHDLGQRLAGIDAAADEMAVIAMRRIGEVARLERHHRRRPHRLMADIEMVAADILVLAGHMDDQLLEAPHREHALEQRRRLVFRRYPHGSFPRPLGLAAAGAYTG